MESKSEENGVKRKKQAMHKPRKNVLYARLPKSVSLTVGAISTGAATTLDTFFKSNCSEKNLQTLEVDMEKRLSLGKVAERTIRKDPKKKKLSLKERRKLGLYNLNRKGLKYEDVLPLHNLWTGYINMYLKISYMKANGFTGKPVDKEWDQFSSLLLKADYHGAMVEIKRSKCSSLVGQSGIIVFDTKNTFKLVGHDNIVRTIPKETCVFTLTVDVYQLTIFGKHMCIRPAERSVKKMKSHMMADL